MSHISYSELKTWAECPRKHKLTYIDRIRRFIGNEYTAFGRSLHALCEHAVQGTLDERDYDDFFDEHFDRELEQLGEEHQRKEQLITEMRDQAKIINKQINYIDDRYFDYISAKDFLSIINYYINDLL